MRPWTDWAWEPDVKAYAAWQPVAVADSAYAAVGWRRPRLRQAVLSLGAKRLHDRGSAWRRPVPWLARAGDRAAADHCVAAEAVAPPSPAAFARSPVSASSARPVAVHGPRSR